MKFVSLSVPPPFSTGPQYDEDGNLIPGSWPTGLPHEGIEGWTILGAPKGGRDLIDMVVPDDWPLQDIPTGWLANGAHRWDMLTQDEYSEAGELVQPGLKTDMPTDYTEYNSHFEDHTDESRVHVIAGWPVVHD